MYELLTPSINTMKKSILAVVLLLAAVVCAQAQNLSSLSKAARMAYDYLQSEGYKPTIDEDNDVAFKYQGYSCYVTNDNDDPTFLSMYIPNVYSVDTEDVSEEYSALTVCNEYNRGKKLVKSTINSNGKICFTAETYICNATDMQEFIETALEFMVRGIGAWRDMYNEL